MKKFLREFKEFALRGNVIDLAIGVIIGAAFQKIVNSLVSDMISPIVGIVANTDFSDLVFKIRGVEIRYGAFITSIVNFIIMALVIFVFIKIMNRLSEKISREHKREEKTKKCRYCCNEIDICAIRCPHCTSILVDDVIEDEQPNLD